jgi:signal transduction histidine kinase
MATETRLLTPRAGRQAPRLTSLSARTAPLALYRRLVPLASDLPAPQRDLLRRIERRTWLLVTLVAVSALLAHGVVHVLLPDSLTEIVGDALVVASAAVPITLLLLREAFTRADSLVRQQAALRAEREQAARVEAALLVARTAAHRVKNALTPLAGYTGLLAQQPAVQADPRLARYATAAQESAQRAAAEIARLQRIVRLAEDTVVALPAPVLDLDRSTAPGETPGRHPSG